MRKKWLVLLCLLVIGSGGAMLWIWSAQHSETAPSLLLPDSNRVHLVAVTVGTNARIPISTPNYLKIPDTIRPEKIRREPGK